MNSWKDGVSLICFIIRCMEKGENMPGKFFNIYHIIPCYCNKKLSQGLNLERF